MPQNTLSPPENAVTEIKPPPLFSTVEYKDLFEMDIRYGRITDIYHNVNDHREETSLRITDEEGINHDFKGLGAYEAVTHKERRVKMYVQVVFYTNKETKAVVAFQETFFGA